MIINYSNNTVKLIYSNLQLTDMRDTAFKPKQYINIFPGTGHHLGGKGSPSRLLPSTQQARNGGVYKETSELPGPTIPLNTFLSRLPQCIVRGGKIIDVCNGIQNALQVSNCDYIYFILTNFRDDIISLYMHI